MLLILFTLDGIRLHVLRSTVELGRIAREILNAASLFLLVSKDNDFFDVQAIQAEEGSVTARAWKK